MKTHFIHALVVQEAARQNPDFAGWAASPTVGPVLDYALSGFSDAVNDLVDSGRMTNAQAQDLFASAGDYTATAWLADKNGTSSPEERSEITFLANTLGVPVEEARAMTRQDITDGKVPGIAQTQGKDGDDQIGL